MSKEINLEITATGGIQMLQDDTLDLCELGCVETKRASHVEFSNEKQCWFVQSAKTKEILNHPMVAPIVKQVLNPTPISAVEPILSL